MKLILTLLLLLCGTAAAAEPSYVITEGDSMTYGSGVPAGSDWPHLMDLPGTTINNIAVAGTQTYQMTPVRTTGPLGTDGSAAQVAVFWGGFNDCMNTRDPDLIKASITTWKNTVHAAYPNAKLVIATIADGKYLGDQGVQTASRDIRDIMNPWIRANSLGFDAVVDIGATPQSADCSTRTWRTADYTHFNAAANAIFADMFQEAILALFSTPPPVTGTATATAITTVSLSVSPP